jgi:hypothetical protein
MHLTNVTPQVGKFSNPGNTQRRKAQQQPVQLALGESNTPPGNWPPESDFGLS